MSAKTGKDFRLNRFEDPDTWEALGIVNPCEPFVNVLDLVTEEGTEARKLGLLEPMLVGPQINPTILLQRFDYLTTYAMITAEGPVPAHDLRWTDGITKYTLGDCKVNTCEVTVPLSGAVKAVMTIPAKTLDPTTYTADWQKFTEKPLTRKNVTVLTVGASDLNTRFTEIAFAVDNRVSVEGRGTGITPQDVYEKEARYSGRIDVVVTGAMSMMDVYGGTKRTVTIALQDRQTTPVIRSFMYTDAVLKVSRLSVRGLGRLIERIEFEGDSLTIGT